MNETRQVVVLQMASFLTFTLGRGKDASIPDQQQLVAWALLTIILLVGTDLDTTAEVSAALAWLIFLAVMFQYGTRFFARLGSMVGAETPYRGTARKPS